MGEAGDEGFGFFGGFAAERTWWVGRVSGDGLERGSPVSGARKLLGKESKGTLIAKRM